MRAIPFDDLDPSALPSDPLPPQWVRDAEWLLAHVNTAANVGYIAEAKARGFGPVHGFIPSTERLVGLAPVSLEVVLSEFEQQSLLLPGRLRLSAGQGVGCCPLLRPVAFVSLSPVVDDSLVESAPLHQAPADWLVVGAIAGDRRWTDALVATEPAEGLEFARRTSQPYYVVWEPGSGHGTLTIRDGSGNCVSTQPAQLTRAVRPCPMIPDAPCGQLCWLYGGPWVARSIRAAARWIPERSVRLADVGCDTCADGALTYAPGPHGPQVRAGLLQFALDVRTGRPVEGRTGSVGPSRYGTPVGLTQD